MTEKLWLIRQGYILKTEMNMIYYLYEKNYKRKGGNLLFVYY